VIENDAEGDERHDGRSGGGAIRDAVRKHITERRLSKEERNIVNDVEWGLSG